MISGDLQLEDLELIKKLENSEFLPNIKETYIQIKELLDSRIPTIFGNYTLHNTKHSFRIMEYMAALVGNLDELNELELALLVYAALLHDIGMAVSDEDIDLIKSDTYPLFEVKYSSMKKFLNNDEDMALTEYVRKFHSSLSAHYIREKLSDKMKVPGLNLHGFANELAIICESHTKDFDWLKSNLTVREIRGKYFFNPQFIACILRLADILDIDSSRTPYRLYEAINPSGISKEEWQQHFIISNTDKIEYDKITNRKKIVFHGTTQNAMLHRKILSYIDWVKDELNESMDLLNNMTSQYNLIYDPAPEINIKPIGFTFSDYKMTLDYKAISALLMGEKIYGNKNLGLRELIQNSLDSCKVRREVEERNFQLGEDRYIPKVKVIIDPENSAVIIKDNGIGMSMEIIKKHFLNIGVSYYNSLDFKLRDFNYKPIGNFGIGFLSCFMLSNNVKVITRNHKAKHKFTVELEKNNEYTSLTQTDDFNFQGTEVVLEYSVFMKVFENNFSAIQEFMSRYFLTDGVKLELINKNETLNIVNTINLENQEDCTKIDFSLYLKEIEGFAIIKRKKDYIVRIEDLDFEGELYSYDDANGIVKVDEFSFLELDHYIEDNKLKYMSIPLVEQDVLERFLNGMKFTNHDILDVIEKLDRELKWISIIVTNDLQHQLDSCTMDNSNQYFLFEKLTLAELIKLGHSDNCSTAIKIKTINIYEGKKNEVYLPFEEGERYMYRYSDKKRKELFVRNVLIKDFLFNLPFSASIFEIESLVININSRNFIPDISRNNFDYSTKNEINYIIGKALHLGALNHFTLTNNQNFTLQNFTNKYYSKITDYEKVI